MKNTYIKLLALLFVASASVSCVNDDETFGTNDNKAIATTTVTSLTLNEGESAVIPFTLNRAINKASQFKIVYFRLLHKKNQEVQKQESQS